MGIFSNEQVRKVSYTPLKAGPDRKMPQSREVAGDSEQWWTAAAAGQLLKPKIEIAFGNV